MDKPGRPKKVNTTKYSVTYIKEATKFRMKLHCVKNKIDMVDWLEIIVNEAISKEEQNGG